MLALVALLDDGERGGGRGGLGVGAGVLRDEADAVVDDLLVAVGHAVDHLVQGVVRQRELERLEWWDRLRRAGMRVRRRPFQLRQAVAHLFDVGRVAAPQKLFARVDLAERHCPTALGLRDGHWLRVTRVAIH